MKKITLALFASICAIGTTFSQANITIQTLTYQGDLLDRLPNGTVQHKSLRGTYLLRQSEIPVITPTLMTSVSFVRTDGTDPFASAGTFTLYMENTSHTTYQKGASYTGALTGMTQHFVGAWSTPTTIGQALVTVSLTPTFSYTGGGIYFAYAFEETTPAVNTNTWQARYAGHQFSSNIGALSFANTNLAAADQMTLTSLRPLAFLTFSNHVTNDIDVTRIVAFGKAPTTLGSQTIQAVVHNRSNVAMNNIPVSINITGANAFTDSKTVGTLAAGAQATVSFNSYNATNFGVSNMSVTVPTDEVNTNNQEVWTQSVSCANWANNPPLPAASFTSGNIGIGTGSGILSTAYTSPSNLNLTGIRMAVATYTDVPGKDLYGVLLNSTGGVIATTNTLNITSGMQGTDITFNFAVHQPLVANQLYHIGVAMPAAPMHPFAALSYPGYTVAGYYFSSLTGSTLTPVNFGFMGVEALIVSPTMSLSAAPSSNSVCAGQSVTLTATGPANSTYSWSGTQSPSTVVVTPAISPTQTQVVTNYNVEGVDGNSCELVGAVASVTVFAVPTIAVTSKSMCVGSKTTLSPTGALSYTINGGSFNNTSGTVFSITPTAAGTVTYAIVGSNTVGCTSQSVAATVITSPCVGIDEIAGGNAIRIYPNPATGGVSKISGLQGSNVLTVYNTLGEAVITENSNEGTVEINLSNLAAGNYLVKVQGDSGAQTFKLVNQK
jgi:hypothetical protein